MFKEEAQKSQKTKKKNDPNSKRKNVNLCLEDHNYNYQYCGSPVSVPFIWESEPGTPKSKLNNCQKYPLPPLTPPPSYFTRTLSHSNNINNINVHSSNKSKNKIFSNNIFTKPRKSAAAASSSSSSSRSSSTSPRFSGTTTTTSYSVPSSPAAMSRLMVRKSFESSRRVRPGKEERDEYDRDSPVSTLSFGSVGRGGNRKSTGCYASMIKMLIAYT